MGIGEAFEYWKTGRFSPEGVKKPASGGDANESTGQPPRCDCCGRFSKHYVIRQPETESWRTEQSDPLLVCERCVEKGR